MSRNPVDTLRLLYEAASRDDLDAVIELAETDVELVPPAESPVTEPVRGVEGLRAWWADQRETVGELSIQAEEYVEAEDHVVVLVRLRVRPHGTDSELDLSIAHLWTVRDGRLVRCQIFPERGKALEAVGLSG